MVMLNVFGSLDNASMKPGPQPASVPLFFFPNMMLPY